jgi:hypothetical protein
MEVLPRPAGMSRQTSPEAVVEEATPPGTTIKINIVAISAMDGGGVDMTKSTKNIGAPSPPPDDGAIEALPRPVGTSTITNAAADEKSSKNTAAGPSTAAGLSPAVGLKNKKWIMLRLTV